MNRYALAVKELKTLRLWTLNKQVRFLQSEREDLGAVGAPTRGLSDLTVRVCGIHSAIRASIKRTIVTLLFITKIHLSFA